MRTNRSVSVAMLLMILTTAFVGGCEEWTRAGQRSMASDPSMQNGMKTNWRVEGSDQPAMNMATTQP